MKTIIAGSRKIDDKEFVFSSLDEIHKEQPITLVICGMANGPDLIGKEWAEHRGIPVLSSPANWSKYGPAAGPIRNSEMAKEAEALIAFWDGVSTGTKDMIKKMKGRPNRIIIVDGGDHPKIDM